MPRAGSAFGPTDARSRPLAAATRMRNRRPSFFKDSSREESKHSTARSAGFKCSRPLQEKTGAAVLLLPSSGPCGCRLCVSVSCFALAWLFHFRGGLLDRPPPHGLPVVDGHPPALPGPCPRPAPGRLPPPPPLPPPVRPPPPAVVPRVRLPPLPPPPDATDRGFFIVARA
jgi:hypothetical protein